MASHSALPQASGYRLRSRPTYIGLGVVIFVFMVVMLLRNQSATSGSLMSEKQPARYVFAFGDSYTDMGYHPGGGGAPSQYHPFGNIGPAEAFTNSGGPKWIHTLIHKLSPENTLCYDFAWRYSTVANRFAHTDALFIPPPDMVGQITNQFDGTLVKPKKKPNWTASNSVAIVWFGINDVELLIDKTFTLDDPLRRYFEMLDELRKRGVMRFVLLDVPPFNLSPGYAVGQRKKADTVQARITQWNAEMVKRTEIFKRQHQRTSVTVVKPSLIFNEIFEKGKDQDKNCHSDDGYSCWWVANIHPGQELHNATAYAVRDALADLGFYDVVSDL